MDSNTRLLSIFSLLLVPASVLAEPPPSPRADGHRPGCQRWETRYFSAGIGPEGWEPMQAILTNSGYLLSGKHMTLEDEAARITLVLYRRCVDGMKIATPKTPLRQHDVVKDGVLEITHTPDGRLAAARALEPFFGDPVAVETVKGKRIRGSISDVSRYGLELRRGDQKRLIRWPSIVRVHLPTGR